MAIRFTKMHGLGNDFMIIDAITQSIRLTPEQIRQWGDRHRGIGFDQLLVVEPPSRPEMDFYYRIYNANGSEAEQCGNGARCFARFVYDKALINQSTIHVETLAGDLVLQIHDDDQVSVDMGQPLLAPQHIPFNAPQAQQQPLYTLPIDGYALASSLSLCAVSMGNPHCVIRVAAIEQAPVAELGPLLQQHPSFPKGVNVGFMQIIDKHRAKLRVYERGAGETLACGSGACAAMVAGGLNGWLDQDATIELPGGSLRLQWSPQSSVIMTGPATSVFNGTV